MLAWRALSRCPVSVIRQTPVCRIQRRQLNVSFPRANWQMTQPRGPGLYAKLRFRKDGTPRSLRWLLKSLFGISLLLNLHLLGDVWIYGGALQVGHAMFLLLRLDADYDRLNLNDPEATSDFFEKILTSIHPLVSKLVINGLRWSQKPTGTVHEIMRDCIEKIHLVFPGIERKGNSLDQSYDKIIRLVRVTRARLWSLERQPRQNEDDKQSLEHNHRASAKGVAVLDRTSEPPAEKAASKAPPDYESIG